MKKVCLKVDPGLRASAAHDAPLTERPLSAPALQSTGSTWLCH